MMWQPLVLVHMFTGVFENKVFHTSVSKKILSTHELLKKNLLK